MGALDRYTLDNLLRVVRDPKLIVGEFRRLNVELHQRRGRSGEPFDIMGADWDNMLILDACRYDLFADRATLPGELHRIDTGASKSEEFMERQFSEQYHDTVYVTSNPFAVEIESGIFHSVVNLFEDAWDETLETVRPGPVTDAALSAVEEYPNKRIIVHYMQPHFPFIGEYGRTLETGNLSGVWIGNQLTEDRPSIWALLQSGQSSASLDAVRKAYAENYDVVEPEVERFWTSSTGKTVVTADHGNLLGERLPPLFLRGFGHPNRVRHPNLTHVPWLELPVSTRRNTVNEPPRSVNEIADDVVTDRLRDLGYQE